MKRLQYKEKPRDWISYVVWHFFLDWRYWAFVVVVLAMTGNALVRRAWEHGDSDPGVLFATCAALSVFVVIFAFGTGALLFIGEGAIAAFWSFNDSVELEWDETQLIARINGNEFRYPWRNFRRFQEAPPLLLLSGDNHHENLTIPLSAASEGLLEDIRKYVGGGCTEQREEAAG